jgi:hypothetical protein
MYNHVFDVFKLMFKGNFFLLEEGRDIIYIGPDPDVLKNRFRIRTNFPTQVIKDDRLSNCCLWVKNAFALS